MIVSLFFSLISEDEAVGAPEETPMSRGSTPSQEAPTQEEQVKEGVPSVSEGSPQAVSPGPNKEEDPEMDIVTGKGLETSSQLPGSSNSALQVAAQPAGSESVIDEHQEDVSSAKVCIYWKCWSVPIIES